MRAFGREDINDGTFLSQIALCSGEGAMKEAKDFLERAGLPNAQNGQSFDKPNSMRLYLNPEAIGLTAVFYNASFMDRVRSLVGRKPDRQGTSVFDACDIVDPHVLQPLHSICLSETCRFEIVQGVGRVGVDVREAQKFRRTLKHRKIDFYNPMADFIGVIRAPDDPREEQRVIVNRRSIRPMANFEQMDVDAGLQNRVYASLREQFKEACDSGLAAPLREALAECRKINALPKSDSYKILNDHWNGDGPRTDRRREISLCAQAYEQERRAFAA